MSALTSRVIQVAFASMMLTALYVRAATASVRDDLVPGLTFIHTWLHPVHLAAVALGFPLVAGQFLPRWRAIGARLTQNLALASASAAAVVLVLVLLSELQLVELPCAQGGGANGLSLRFSLLCPQFSGRSSGAPFSTALLSSAMFWVSSRVVRSKRAAA